jgi:selenide,water dikinase
MKRAATAGSEIVLGGGGHAHVHVLAAFGRSNAPGARVTLITPDLKTPYSGMLPGAVAGLYGIEDCHIDLARLAAATGTRLVHARAVGLDHTGKTVLCAGSPPISYDAVSIDIGSTPTLDAIPGAFEHGIAVKPISEFLAKFERLRDACRRAHGPRRIAVIGGGAGGVELLLSMRTRLREDAMHSGRDPDAFTFTLVTEGDILPTHNRRVRAAFRRAFAARGMRLIERKQVIGLHADAIALADGHAVENDAVLVVTQAGAPEWFRATGLALDEHGFLAVGPTMQSLDDPAVFAAGDCAALVDTPREKAGVYAVRAGPPLARNLHRFVQGTRLRRWRPQARHLALISTGERYAVASRGWLKTEGAWVWTLKDWIDRRWMRRYKV